MRVIVRFTSLANDAPSMLSATTGSSHSFEKTTNTEAAPAVGEMMHFRHEGAVVTGVVTKRIWVEEKMNVPDEYAFPDSYTNFTCILDVQETQ